MFNIIKLVFTRPLEALIILLCVGYTYMHVEVFEVKKAQAVTIVLQSQQVKINEKVNLIGETLIRVDENVKIIKDSKCCCQDGDKV